MDTVVEFSGLSRDCEGVPHECEGLPRQHDGLACRHEESARNSTAPARLVDVWRAACGARFTMRPVAPHDLRALGDMFGRLSRMARYNRFHGALAVPEPLLHAMTHVDPRQQLALVVTTAHASHEPIVAEARYVIEADGHAAEFGLVVEDRWQRKGIARRILQTLIDTARARGLRTLYGSVIRDNTPMLSLARCCGFTSRTDPDDRRLARVELRFV